MTSNYTEPKAYHLVSLSPFMLKAIEKLMDRHIKDDILGLCPVHQYYKGSPPKLLYHMTTRTEEAAANRIDILGAFLGKEGAFDNTKFEIITKSPEWHGHGDIMCWWSGSMLGGSKIIATLAGETLRESVARGSLWGGGGCCAFYCGQTHRKTKCEWLLYTVCR